MRRLDPTIQFSGGCGKFVSKSYVGGFAGTLLGLSEFQVVNAPSGCSRDAEQSYKNYNPPKVADPLGAEDNDNDKNLFLYDPFYSLTTISIARSPKIKDDVHDELMDIRKYGYNGRPLFAAMLRSQGSAAAPELTLAKNDIGDGITNPTMYNILRRVLLSPKEEWTTTDNSIASVLATRVQLGLANYDFVNKSTSSGYAMLVRYDSPESHRQDPLKKFGTVAIAFPPDPVCAALAMGLMQPGWTLRKGAVDTEIRGREPNFWVKAMARLFDQHFCLPNRGDCGEVFVALYMLLCADVLRFQNDPHMRLFEVDLEEWLRQLERETLENPKPSKRQKFFMETDGEEGPKRRRSPRRPANNITQEKRLTLNFIQVCRNYFRSHAWLGQSMLQYMSDTATGCYVYPLCPAIDIVFPIKKLDAQGATSYHPCLVSVKCWDSITFAHMDNALNKMKGYLQECRPNEDKSTSALCLLFVIGSSTIPDTRPARKGSFPREDAFITIVVPSRDMFGVNETIQNMAGASHISELLASHSFAYAEENIERALRVTATAMYRDLGKSLLGDKQKLWEAQNQTK